MKTSDSHQASHVSNTHSDQPFFRAKAEQVFFGKGRSPSQPFFNLSSTPSTPVQAKLMVEDVGGSYEQKPDLLRVLRSARVAAEGAIASIIQRFNRGAITPLFSGCGRRRVADAAIAFVGESPNNTQMLTRTTQRGSSKLASKLTRVSRPQNRATSWMQMMYWLDCAKGSKPPKPPLNEKSTDYAFRQPGFR